MASSESNAFHRDRYRPLPERFWTRVEKGDEHWLWMSTVAGTIPQIKAGGKNLNARRVAWELCRGPIPPRHQVYVTCTEPLCVFHLAIRRVEDRPIHPNSIAAVRRHCRNAALPPSRTIPVYFQPEHLSDAEVAARTGLGVKTVWKLRTGTRPTPNDRTRALRSVVLREGIDTVVKFLAGHYPTCPKCALPMRRYARTTGRIRCDACGKSKKIRPQEIRRQPLLLDIGRVRRFLELIADGKPARQATLETGLASTTVVKLRTVLFEEFGLPNRRATISLPNVHAHG